MNDINKKKEKSCIKYSLDAAMKDAIDYYYAGTSNGALLAIFTEISDKTKDAETTQKDIIDSEYQLTVRQKEVDMRKQEQKVGIIKE